MSSVKPIPDGYHSIQPYMMYKNCSAAIAFYHSAFGATEKFRMHRPDGTIQHSEMQFGDCVVMLADENVGLDALSIEHFGGSPVGIYFYVEDCDKLYAQAVAAGATSLSEPADQSYGDRTAGVQDPFGYKWWLGTSIRN